MCRTSDNSHVKSALAWLRRSRCVHVPRRTLRITYRLARPPRILVSPWSSPSLLFVPLGDVIRSQSNKSLRAILVPGGFSVKESPEENQQQKLVARTAARSEERRVGK